MQAQSNHLYALYATNDQAPFATKHEAAMAAESQDIAKAGALAEFKSYESKLTELSSKQEVLTNQFVQIMGQSEVDWDAARVALFAFSNSANEMAEHWMIWQKRFLVKHLLMQRPREH